MKCIEGIMTKDTVLVQLSIDIQPQLGSIHNVQRCQVIISLYRTYSVKMTVNEKVIKHKQCDKMSFQKQNSEQRMQLTVNETGQFGPKAFVGCKD